MSERERMTDDELYEWAYRHQMQTTGAGPRQCHEYAVLAVYHRRPEVMRKRVDELRNEDLLDACEHPGDFTTWCRICRPSDGEIQEEIVRLRRELRERDASG